MLISAPIAPSLTQLPALAGSCILCTIKAAHPSRAWHSRGRQTAPAHAAKRRPSASRSTQTSAKAASSHLHERIRAAERATVTAMPSAPAPTAAAVLLSAHAAEQYQERVKAGLDIDAARGELERLRPLGQVSAHAPSWVNAARPAPYYLLIGDAIVLPLAPHRDGWVATTCVTQRTLTPTRRAAKSARKTSLGASKRAVRRARF
jgi:hypothetical protein